MGRRFPMATAAALMLMAAAPSMQQLPPGYVDPEPVLRAASQAIGADNLKCVTISGTQAYGGAVGQQRIAGVGTDWPRIPFTTYTRTMNWDARSMREDFERKPGQNPASWKWGSGWLGGTPVQKNARQTFSVNGTFAWSQDGPASPPVAARAEDAERWQLDLWLNPHGFLKAARMPGANPKATWRWELGEMGRDGPTATPPKVTVVSITMMGKYRVDATINQDNLIQRIHTNVPDSVFGDMNYEHEPASTPGAWVDVGNGVKFPVVWHHHEGWDDNYAAQLVNGGHNAFDGRLTNIQANVCPDPVTVPDAVRQATFAERVDVQKLSDGVYLMGGTSHNSVAIGFRDYVALVEAPLNERRSLAVIDEIVKLFPGKPIRFVVNTHQHHDHIGGLRGYMHIGATIVTHAKNFQFFTRDVLNYRPRILEPDMVSQWPPTELAEGYYYEQVTENYTLTDETRTLRASYVHPLQHADGMLMVYLLRERMVIEADLLDTHEPLPAAPTDANRALYNQVQRLKLDVAQIVPIHGKPIAWNEFAKMFASAGRSADFLALGPGFPLWAYGYKTVPAAPADWSGRCPGTRPRDCDRPGGMPTATSNALLRLEGSDRSFTVAEITAPYNPADWFPGDHPRMPDIVARGKEATGFRACAICHYPNGQGLMQNAPVAGLPVDYFLRQLADFASGRRKSADVNKANAFEMAAMARNLTPAEARVAAEYFGSMPFRPWIRVVESDIVPKFTATVNGLFLKADGNDTEPLGRRIVEMPEDSYQTNMLRNPRLGMVAYAPVGSVRAGEMLVKTGGGGRTQTCGTCHGPELTGTKVAPPIAGRQPGYLARQMYDMQKGTRNGEQAKMMKAAVEKLTDDDLIAITAYVASLRP